MSLNPINPNDPNLRSFAEIDRELLLPKGSAFRAFKALADEFREGEDFLCCDSRLDPAGFVDWTATGRFYGGTVNAVLLGARAQSRLKQGLGR